MRLHERDMYFDVGKTKAGVNLRLDDWDVVVLVSGRHFRPLVYEGEAGA